MVFNSCDLIRLCFTHLSRKCVCSSSSSQTLHNHSSRGILTYLSLSIIPMYALILDLHTAFLCSSTDQIRDGCKIYDVDIVLWKNILKLFSCLHFDQICTCFIVSSFWIDTFSLFLFLFCLLSIGGCNILSKFNPLAGAIYVSIYLCLMYIEIPIFFQLFVSSMKPSVLSFLLKVRLEFGKCWKILCSLCIETFCAVRDLSATNIFCSLLLWDSVHAPFPQINN